MYTNHKINKMKPIIQKLWMFIAVLCASLSVSVYGFESDELSYRILSEENRTVELVAPSSPILTDIEIPRRVIYQLKTYTVTSIGDWAFNKYRMVSVTIPNSVTSIGKGAFCGCISLKSITIPNSVTSIEDNAFDGCSRLTSVTIGNSVTSIGNYAFYSCSRLTSVTIGNSVTSIGAGAFSECSSLTSVTIPNSMTSIGKGAFEKCSRLTSVTIPNSVTFIGEGAFEECI